MPTLWASDNDGAWNRALQSYEEVIARQAVGPLVDLDKWYQRELPSTIAGRTPPHVTYDELVKLTEWKMARGVWRARNLVLVRGNDAERVVKTSTTALSLVPHPTKPIAELASLDGVGPATASAVAAAFAPDTYPFFDELVANQIPGLGKLAFTMGYYGKYGEALRQRATKLGSEWTVSRVERALWAHVGGKARV